MCLPKRLVRGQTTRGCWIVRGGARRVARNSGARATALVLHVGRRTPADAVDIMRAQTGEGVRIGASAVNGVAVARLLASSHSALQGALARIVQTLDGAPVPRAWTL